MLSCKVDEMPEPSIDSAEMESCDPSDLIEVAADSGETLTVVSAEKLNLKSVKKRSYKILSDLPLEEWCLPDDCLQKTAEVVGILEEKNSRLAMGRLELALGSQRKWAKFSPSDSRLPRMMIEASQLPKDFFERPQDFGKFLFLARIVEWAQNSIMARGSLEKELGLAGDIDAETEGLLVTNDIDTSEFSEAVIECLPSVPEGGWKIDEVEFANRRDLRDEIIFTIDPKTARDLDDALSISPCDNVDGCGTPGWEIGVHIADVSYFVDENTELDQWASQRATSVYLVQQVIPMLPRLLCEELCSLNAGVDRLTFSVIWKVDDKANIFEEWFGRTIIRSRVKLTYEHAQDFIENPDKDFQDTEMPEISDNVTVHQLKEKVLQLNGIAKLLRQRRRESGSLQLNQPKLKFALDDDNKSPIGVSIYEAKDSNHLVEEFMLLANMAVARKIERHFRKTALLRCHPPPKKKVLRDALKLCNTIGFPIDGTSSGELSQALAPFRSNSRLSQSINQVLSTVLMKAMELARYFCTGTVSSPTQYHHYALNVPYYTHFTSPIRRYPDIIVHRLLAASLGYCQPSERTVEELKKIADHCNDKKLIAKKVGESSAEMFFAVLVQRIGPMEAKGVVVNVLDLAFDVLLIKYGVVKRIYVKSLDMRREPSFDEASARLTLYWSTDDGPVEQLIQMCTIVDVVLTGEPNSTKFNAVIKAKSKEESPTLVELWREVEPNNVEGNNLDLGTILLEDS
uniref:DIS3-like exonuclease 2 n=1 Tax=Haemonchus contortus TaxID=6289 RepID=A0A7I4YSR7_HAECO